MFFHELHLSEVVNYLHKYRFTSQVKSVFVGFIPSFMQGFFQLFVQGGAKRMQNEIAWMGGWWEGGGRGREGGGGGRGGGIGRRERGKEGEEREGEGVREREEREGGGRERGGEAKYVSCMQQTRWVWGMLPLEILILDLLLDAKKIGGIWDCFHTNIIYICQVF